MFVAVRTAPGVRQVCADLRQGRVLVQGWHGPQRRDTRTDPRAYVMPEDKGPDSLDAAPRRRQRTR